MVGQKEMEENSRKKTRKGDKLSNRWINPYTVSEQLVKGTYNFTPVDNESSKERITVNAKHLNQYADTRVEDVVSNSDTSPSTYLHLIYNHL